MTKIAASILCMSLALQLVGEGNVATVTPSDRVSKLAEKIQYGLDNLLTNTKRVRHNSYVYNIIDQNADFSDTIEFKKISITAETTSVEIDMNPDAQTGEGVVLIGIHHQPKFMLHPNNGFPIFIDVFVNTEFRRSPDHDLEVSKDYTNTLNAYVEWTLYNNQRVLFSPVGFKTSPIELPIDPTNYLVQGDFVDTDLALNGICLIDGMVYIVADTQDVTITLNETSWLMNSTAEYECALILLANEGLKITFVVNEAMEWRSHLNAQFFVIQGGPGKIEVKIVADNIV